MVSPLSNLTDEKLMELYQNGEYMAFEVIYSRHKNKVYSYLRKRISDPEVVEDLFQSIFIKFHKCRAKYNSKFTLMKWIYTIARSELFDANKKHKMITTPFKDEHFLKQEEHNEDHDERIDIENETFLSAMEKEAIQLRYYSNEDFKIISQRLNTSASNIRKIISRGIKKLRVKYTGGHDG